MNNKNIGIVMFCSLLLSSCGLIEKFSGSDSATESTENTSVADLSSTAPSDDLFNSAPENSSTSEVANTDAPSNVTSELSDDKDELKSLQDEFSNSAPQETIVAEVKEPMVKATPLKIQESAPEINNDLAETDVSSRSTGEVRNYKVQKGDTLMQIAFKLYGDISRWKDLRSLNGDKLNSNASLRSQHSIKYMEPESPFVWNPEGTPYLIKNGETLGTISNSVYQTPKKWKTIWNNNKPLIKNPNVIYAGFTLYYKGSEMANYVQPKTKKNIVEEIKIENQLTAIERLSSDNEEVTDIRAATVRAPASTEEEVIPDTSTTAQPMPDENEEETEEN